MTAFGTIDEDEDTYNTDETKTLDQNSTIIQSTSDFGHIVANMGDIV